MAYGVRILSAAGVLETACHRRTHVVVHRIADVVVIVGHGYSPVRSCTVQPNASAIPFNTRSFTS